MAALTITVASFSGSYLTNTNQSASYLRNPAQGANIDATSAYYNPAGTAFLPHDGYYVSISNQSVFQTRSISSVGMWDMKALSTQNYEATAAAPLIPSATLTYKKGRFAASGHFGLAGGGGKAVFNTGIPSFESLIKNMLYMNPALTAALGGNHLTPDMYKYDSNFAGYQYLIGGQFGVAYQVTDWLSVYGGARMNYMYGGYEGKISVVTGNANLDPALPLINVDVEQTGWGITPIVGVDAKFGALNLGVKYEMLTNLNVQNKSNNTIKNVPTNEAISAFDDGKVTPSDVPAMLTMAAQYAIMPSLRISGEGHYYFDKQARMNGNKQDLLVSNSYELMAGVEYDINKRFTVSGGYLMTEYGNDSKTINDINMNLSSYSLGFGGVIKISDRINVNISYLFTNYSDATVQSMFTKDSYSRTNKVVGFGMDYTF